jgi:hypothetical protein
MPAVFIEAVSRFDELVPRGAEIKRALELTRHALTAAKRSIELDNRRLIRERAQLLASLESFGPLKIDSLLRLCGRLGS